MLAVAIQSHPARRELRRPLEAALGDPLVVEDPDPSGPPSAWRCYRAILEQAPTNGHLLILQDDVVACRNLLPAVAAAVVARPGRLLSFFAAGQPSSTANRVRQALAAGDAWAVIDPQRWCPTVALCWPAPMIPRLLEYVDAQGWERLRGRRAFTADDEIVGRFLRSTRDYALASCPSLVEHPDVAPSLVHRSRVSRGSNRGRRATAYIGGGDPLLIDWAAGPA